MPSSGWRWRREPGRPWKTSTGSPALAPYCASARFLPSGSFDPLFGGGDGKVTTAKLAPGTQQATIINVLRGHYFNNDPATIGPNSGPHRFLVDCAGFSTGMRIVLQNSDTSSPGFPPPPNGKHHTVYVRGTNTVKRTDGDLRGLGWTADGNDMVNTAVDTGTIQGNDSGTGSFIATSASSP